MPTWPHRPRLQSRRCSRAYSFADVRELADVGGGRGALLAGVLQAHGGMRGILFDLPEVTATASPLQRAGESERSRIDSGTFFDRVPTGADTYALKFILHDWSDNDCIRNPGELPPSHDRGGRVLIIEHVVPERGGPDFAWFMDLNMLVLTEGGRERTGENLAIAGCGGP